MDRDSEDSAPAEYPPDQPEADIVEDDGAAYGAEERELEDALIKEEAALQAQDEDHAMEGAEDTAGPSHGEAVKAEDEESDAGSEDLEAESSGSEDDEGEDEEGEGDADEDMEMADGDEKPADAAGQNGHPIGQQQHEEVMVH